MPQIHFLWVDFTFDSELIEIVSHPHNAYRDMTALEKKRYKKYLCLMLSNIVLFGLAAVIVGTQANNYSIARNDPPSFEYLIFGNWIPQSTVLPALQVAIVLSCMCLVASITLFVFSICWINHLLNKTEEGFENEIDAMRQSYQIAEQECQRYKAEHPMEAHIAKISKEIKKMREDNNRNAALLAVMMMNNRCYHK